MSSLAFFERCLASRLPPRARDWLAQHQERIQNGVTDTTFGSWLSLASRFAPRGALDPTDAERAEARALDAGFDPVRWTVLDAVRAVLILSRPDLDEPSGERALAQAFRYADEGELRALYRSLPHLPHAERFAWQAGEGCRTNMRTVFEAIACDNAYPARHFDDATFRQAVIKCLFVEAPLWRIYGLDDHLDPELARMALDLADERRSAGRPIYPELWLCLGTHGGERGLTSLAREQHSKVPAGRIGAGYGLARAGETELLRAWAEAEADPTVAAALQDALTGPHDQTALRRLDPNSSETP